MIRQWTSVGLPSLEDAVNKAAAQQHARQALPVLPIMTQVYSFALDKGSDHRGMIAMVKRRLEGFAMLILICVWCIYHGYHHIARAVLEVLDNFEWDLSEIHPADQEASNLIYKYTKVINT